MRLWHVVHSRARSLLFRDRREADLNEELQLHIDREMARLRASGVPHEAARRQTLRDFGGVEQIKEACRDARGTAAIDADGRVTSWNEGAKRLKGWDAQEVLGRNFSLFYTGEAVAAGQPGHSTGRSRCPGRAGRQYRRLQPH